jgi:hypothetical protein
MAAQVETISSGAFVHNTPPEPPTNATSEGTTKVTQVVQGGLPNSPPAVIGTKNNIGKAGGTTQIIIQNVMTCCHLQTADWRKVFASITLIVSLALFTFLACYAAGVFHFETFLGTIGSSVTLSGAGCLVLASASLLYLSFKR